MTLMAVGFTVIVFLAGLTVLDLGGLAAARAQAQTAADLAALAALTTGQGRERARAVAEANGARLDSCSCTAVEAIVAVRRRTRLLPSGTVVELVARARAVLPGPLGVAGAGGLAAGGIVGERGLPPRRGGTR